MGPRLKRRGLGPRPKKGEGEEMTEEKKTKKATKKVAKKGDVILADDPKKSEVSGLLDSEKKDLDSSVRSQNDKKKVAEKTEDKKATKTKIKKKAEKGTPKKVEKKSRFERKSKAYRNAFSKIEKGKEYSLEEAVALVGDISTTKFDGSVEIHLNLNIDTKNPEHQIRGSVSLPAGLGKEKRIAVICKEDHQDEAKSAGADLIGGTELIEKITKGSIEFDVLVATPDMMGELAKAGKVLGPKGLMPNPKDNTVTTNLKSTIEDIKKGRAEYRTDSYGIVHSVVGKTSFDREKLLENIEALLKEIHSVKPASIKGTFIKSIYLTTTMGPSIKVKE